MAMELVETDVSETRINGVTQFALATGGRFRIQKQDAGAEIEDELPLQTVPQGKAWTVQIAVYITEDDA